MLAASAASLTARSARGPFESGQPGGESGDGEPLGQGSVELQSGQCPRAHVGQAHSGGGVGRAVLDALLDAARARGDRQAMLHAQLGAARFYERAGFVRRGPAFEEAGIAHVEMIRTL